MLTLVRHAQTVIDPAVPNAEWVLSEQGRAAAAALALTGPALSSSEPKAMETARLAGLDAVVDDRLREASRPWSDTYDADVERYLAGEPLPGWEPAAAVIERMTAALDGFDGVAVSHGLAIALYLGLPFEEWRAMPFPAVLQC